jgi:hypothetical protein
MPDERVADFCTNCGTPNTRKNQFCSECGKPLVKTNDFPGVSLQQNNASPENQEKTQKNTMLIVGGAVVVVLLIVALYASGIGTSLLAQSGVPQSGATTPSQTYHSPAATGTSATTSKIPPTTVYLSRGVTITYPSDWQKEEVSETSMRDYGRITTNIANFYSPDITSERAYLAQPNVDTASYTSLSIDVDPNPVKEFDQYFNRVTLALQDYYGHITITKHNYQLKISPTDTFEGYPAYQMDFDTASMRGSYIFTDVDGIIYIFAFKNPSPYSAEVQNMYKSIKIVSPVVPEPKHR